MKGINVIIQEESYTSKVSFFDNEFIPTYKLNNDKFNSIGKRIHRGLFKGSNILINADINGSLNIMRKYLLFSFIYFPYLKHISDCSL